MRKVIINRKKSIVGCAGKVLIYTLDTVEEKMVITKDKCHFLGKLKNGSILEMEIPENEIIILAAYDNLGMFCVTDYVVLSEGTEDVILNGKVRLNPSKGNPFIFSVNN